MERLAFLLALLCLAGGCSAPVSDSPAVPRDDTTAIDFERLGRIDGAVEAAVADGDLPGAVVLVWSRGRTAYLKAFGRRAVEPESEAMTVDTIFDLASLTKVVATTTAVMLLVEEGRVRLRAPVAEYLPGFARRGKERITVGQLLAHVSGLRPDLDLEQEFDGPAIALERTYDERPVAAPGERFIYSDLNFMLLGEIVERVGGLPLDRFAAERIFEPLGMHETMFRPPAELARRIAPTEACAGLEWPCRASAAGAAMLRGAVHDPTARRMGGVAGHAGLFSTAADLARFGRMLLGGGALDGARVLAPLSVARMTAPATPAGMRAVRGLGWDIDSRYSTNRGDLFPAGSFGHTGFTGTSIWVDPSSRTFVVFLSNRVHPDGGGRVVELRGRVATLAAAAVLDRPAGRSAGDAGRGVPRVQAGIDVLREEGFAQLRGARAALLTNRTGLARGGARTIDLLHESPEVELELLLSPEHGLGGDADGPVADARDAATGLPIYSLYGDTRRPTGRMLGGVDTVVVDLQDAGARFYTYAATLAYVMEAAAERGIRVVVLDRPNPITGAAVEGPLLDEDQLGFTGYLPLPVRHGMTLGELARLFNVEGEIGAELEVVPLRGWRRDLWFDETGLTWVAPSPNLRTVTQAALYPGIGAIEGANLSVGRGTDTPFERLGAPWIDGPALAERLNARRLPGVRAYPVTFTPASGPYAGQPCSGIHLVVTGRDALRPVRLGVEIAAALHERHGAQFEIGRTLRLLGSQETLRRIENGEDPAAIAASWAPAERAWRVRRAPYLLY